MNSSISDDFELKFCSYEDFFHEAEIIGQMPITSLGYCFKFESYFKLARL